MILVIAIDNRKQRHVAERLTAAEYAAEGPDGCATIARQFCRDNGLKFSNYEVDLGAANDAQLAHVKIG